MIDGARQAVQLLAPRFFVRKILAGSSKSLSSVIPDDRNDEVDFIVADEDAVTAIEVKSGRVKSTKGMQRFILENPGARELVVGSFDCPLENFLLGEVNLLV